jgi:signal transduction histidine kinase
VTTTWHRSLYWRVALGVVAFLAAMLVVQAMLFVWAMSQFGRTLPGQSPGRLGMTVALDLANLLERDPQTDLAQYVREQYAKYEHPFFVMMADGQLITSGSQSFPESLVQMARARLQRPDGFPPSRPPRSGMRPFDGPRFDRDPNGPPFARPSPIIVGGRLVGVVVVPPQPPFGFLLGRYAPLLALVAAGVLVVGAALTSVLIFGPARRRLREVETAARRFGAGDLSARAPERGGDEIAAVASAFNAMARDLSARADALAASDRVRRQLLADVSHELTTPVTAMRGYLETLAMPELTLDEATRARYLRIIGDETGRLDRLIGDLLDLARLEGGGGTFAISTVQVADLFGRVEARHERACQEAGVTLKVSIAPGAETVSGDKDRLEQALQNLAANAIRYAPRGSAVTLSAKTVPSGTEVTQRSSRSGGSGESGERPAPPKLADGDASEGGRSPAGTEVTISVKDEGPGIPPDHLPHIFDRFYKADAARAGVSGGSGLGLSIVKAIVERLGGRLTVASRPGSTVFEMTVPRPPTTA